MQWCFWTFSFRWKSQLFMQNSNSRKVIICCWSLRWVICLISLFINIWFTIIKFIWYITVKPSSPIITEAICEETSARIKWESAFDGGAVQSFFVAAFGDAYKSSRSDIITDKGENQTHQAVVPFLQPSVLYTFYVFAKNSIGDTISEKVKCTTLKGIVIS